MQTSKQIAKHLREVYFGGNWTCSSLKKHLSNINVEQATKSVHNLNTVATLTYHIHYYIQAVTKVLKGQPLLAKDELSFNHPPFNSEKEWQEFLDNLWVEAETFAQLIEQLPNTELEKPFTDEKYGIYYRNLNGIIEHTHYHLGQIVLIKKIIQSST